MEKNILLIGMPGSGKTTIGKILSSKINLEFLDMDDFIENYSGRKIPDIFKDGEKSFRDLESRCCEILSRKRNIVVSTGGGAVKRASNMAYFKNFKIIFINRPLDLIFEDINTDTRPLLNNGREKLKTLYRERIDLYKKYCDVEILNNSDIDTVLNKIIKNI